MIRPELAAVAPDYHGAIDFAELAAWGISAENIVDFSVNSNPFGPVDSVREAIANAYLERYPDKACLALRGALSAHLGVRSEQILVGNGSAEIMWLIAFACLNAGDNVLVIGPTFGEYGRNARLIGANVQMWHAQPENDFTLDITAIDEAITTQSPKLVHLCNPNNPTGQVVENAVIERWARQHPDTLFVIDEAYLSFVPNMPSVVGLGLDNVLILRSMTKDYALAGVRLGYVLGSEDLIAGLARVQVPWSVNELAQVAGVAALAAQSEYVAQWQKLSHVADAFRAGLVGLGFRPKPSHTHYFLMHVGDGTALRKKLLKQGLLVRLCESYNLPEFVRISTQTPEQNHLLLAALSELR